jgi:hypothetical protein
MLKNICFAFTFTISLTFSVLAQSTKAIISTKPTPNPPPGNIQLLEKYIHTPAEAIDTIEGQISKTEGITIYYQIGKYVSDYGDRYCGKGECLWYKVQKKDGSQIRIGLTKEGKIVATATKDNANVYTDPIYANFYAQTKSAEDITDFLLMVLTYKVGCESNTVN